MAGLPALPECTLNYTVKAKLVMGELSVDDFRKERLRERFQSLLDQMPKEVQAFLPSVEEPGYLEDSEYFSGDRKYLLVMTLQLPAQHTFVDVPSVSVFAFSIEEEYAPIVNMLQSLPGIESAKHFIEVSICRDDMIPWYVCDGMRQEPSIRTNTLPARTLLNALQKNA